MSIVKDLIKLSLTDKNWLKKIRKLKKDRRKKMILIGSPVHGNLGDHAIAEEEISFLNDYFPEYSIYDIQMPLYNIISKKISSYITREDIILISGGGWMGNLWLHNECTIRQIVSNFSLNTIIILPQTIYYTSDSIGYVELKKTNDIFSKHKNLHLFLREKKSYNFACNSYTFCGNSGAYLFPDMVLYAKGVTEINASNVINRDNRLINVCLRNDCEKTGLFNLDIVNDLEKSYKVNYIDTVVPYRVKYKQRKDELQKMWKIFAMGKLTVTDRLHAMLFSVLNNTPCIALDNKTNKVFGVSQWIMDTKLVYPVNTNEELKDKIRELMYQDNEFIYNRQNLMGEFTRMAKIIKEGIKLNEN